MIPREVIEEIRYRNDIEDVISSYVTLKRAGSNRNGLWAIGQTPTRYLSFLSLSACSISTF